MLANSYSRSRHIAGLTLIEVLIALAIVAIAITAIIKAASQNIRATAYLENKTIAMWVGQNVLNEVRTGLVLLPRAPEQINQATSMLSKDWYWQAEQKETPNEHINKIQVKVFMNENDKATPLIRLESYVYHEE